MAIRACGYLAEFSAAGQGQWDSLLTEQGQVSAVLLDATSSDNGCLETLRGIRETGADLPVIVVSNDQSAARVVAAMKAGATDFLTMPLSADSLRKALERSSANRWPAEPEAARRPAAAKARQGHQTRNPEMLEIRSIVNKLSQSDAPVLVVGETGAGKEVIAREIHASSRRSGKPFLKLNCAALPSELVESELFGYERGAFTGAFQRKLGMFELASGGTLLLDEIGDMDFKLQAKLLQILQDQTMQRLGGSQTIQVDVRIIAATHRDLEKAIEENAFREDLYYRLNVIALHVPALRERPEDIVSLAEHLLRKHTPGDVAVEVLTPDLCDALRAYHWPGNVRELENTMRRLAIFRSPETLARDLQAQGTRNTGRAAVTTLPNPAPVPAPVSPILEQVARAKQEAETDAIVATLQAVRWNRKQAARLLSIDYKALLYKMKKLSIDVNELKLEGSMAASAAS